MKTLMKKVENKTLQSIVNTINEEFTLLDNCFAELSNEELKDITIDDDIVDEYINNVINSYDNEEYIIVDDKFISDTNLYVHNDSLYVAMRTYEELQNILNAELLMISLSLIQNYQSKLKNKGG